jgi:hypothetical protein
VSQGQFGQLRHQLGIVLLVVHHMGVTIRPLDQRVAELAIREPGRVPHEILNRHGTAGLFQGQASLVRLRIHVFDPYLHVAQRRQVAPDRIGEEQLAPFHEHERGDDRHRLGHGSDAKHGGRLHGAQRRSLGVAESLVVGQLPVARDQRDGAGNCAGRHIRAQHFAEAFQPRPREARRFRRRLG